MLEDGRLATYERRASLVGRCPLSPQQHHLLQGLNWGAAKPAKGPCRGNCVAPRASPGCDATKLGVKRRVRL
jgi:hypothetical protein